MNLPNPIFIISGASGAGKGTLIKGVMENHPEFQLTTSATTRPRRPSDGPNDYYFLTDEEFQKRIDDGEFVEWAQYAGNKYGTLKSELESKSKLGPVLLEIEIQGAAQIKKSGVAHTSIFVAPPSMDELERRLRERKSDSEEAISKRLATAKEEMRAAPLYDHVIINDTIPEAVGELEKIVSSYVR